MISAGIDVSSKQLHVVVNNKAGKSSVVKVFGNDNAGINKLFRLLKQRNVSRVVLEATGVYHLDAALKVDKTPHIDVMVLNPKAANHYAKARLSRGKTDAIDAALLADYAQQMPFTAWKAPRDTLMALRACSRRLASLAKQRGKMKNQRHALSRNSTTPDFILEDVELSITQINNQIQVLEKKTLELIRQDEILFTCFKLLISVKGIAEKSAIQLLGELMVLPEGLKAKQWVAMAGLDPRPHQSGTSVNKKTQLNKAGNRYLRHALFMPALSASRHVPEVKAYREHLVKNRGLKKLQAICAVMRKLLHAIHSMWKKQEVFDASCFYRKIELAA